MRPENPRFSLPENTPPAEPTSSAFVACPVFVSWAAPCWGGANIYQVALEQAREKVDRKTVFERELFAVWN